MGYQVAFCCFLFRCPGTFVFAFVTVVDGVSLSFFTLRLVAVFHFVSWQFVIAICHRRRRCRQVRAVAVQLMEVVYGVKDNEWLVKLLRGMISGPGAGDKQKKVCAYSLTSKIIRREVHRILDKRRYVWAYNCRIA